MMPTAAQLDARKLSLYIARRDARPNAAAVEAANFHAPDPHDQHLYASAYATPHDWPPELALRAAVLADALRILIKWPIDSERFREAERWVFDTPVAWWPFCFSAVCEALGYDVQAMRRMTRAVMTSERPIVPQTRAARVLRYLHEHGPATKAEIALALHLESTEVDGAINGLMRLHRGAAVERVERARYRAVLR